MLKPLMVAVGGGSGSGKTTVVRQLEQHLSDIGVLVVSQDHYYLDLSHLFLAERESRNFDHPGALDGALLRKQMASLAHGLPIDRPTYDFATHTRSSKTEKLLPKPIIFFDGILSLSDRELLNSFDLSIYIDVPSDIRILRRLQRDVAERGRSVENVISQYLNTVRPMHETYVGPTKNIADIVVEWIDRDETKIANLANLLRSKCLGKSASAV